MSELLAVIYERDFVHYANPLNISVLSVVTIFFKVLRLLVRIRLEGPSVCKTLQSSLVPQSRRLYFSSNCGLLSFTMPCTVLQSPFRSQVFYTKSLTTMSQAATTQKLPRDFSKNYGVASSLCEIAHAATLAQAKTKEKKNAGKSRDKSNYLNFLRRSTGLSCRL